MKVPSLWQSMKALLNMLFNPHFNTDCSFTDGISELEFEHIVRETTKQIERVQKITINGPIVTGEVLSRSGITVWVFHISFNDKGHLSGNYWISTNNSDSMIPQAFGEKIKEAIQLRLPRQ